MTSAQTEGQSGRICTLHIGMPKTGTTSIQTALAGYDDGRTSYCGFSGINHGLPMITLFSARPETYRVYRRTGAQAEDVARMKARFQRQLTAELTSKTSHTIISGEVLCQDLERDEIAALIAALSPHYSDIRVLVYLRPFQSFMVSAFQESVKGGRSFAAFMRPIHAPYRRRFERWLEVVGAGAIRFVRYDRASLTGGDVVDDFCARVGIDATLLQRKVANETLSAEAVAALYCFNSIVGFPSGSPAANQRRLRLIERARVLGNSRFSFAPDLAAQLIETYRDDILWMEQVAGFSLRDEPVSADVAIGSEQDLMRFAAEQVPRLRGLLPDHPPLPEGRRQRCAALMRHLCEIEDFDAG